MNSLVVPPHPFISLHEQSLLTRPLRRGKDDLLVMDGLLTKLLASIRRQPTIVRHSNFPPQFPRRIQDALLQRDIDIP